MKIISYHINEKHKNNECTNSSPIRILYKQVGKTPEVKIIKDLFKLKKAIVINELQIIPYKKAYIICSNKNLMSKLPINVVMPLYNIAGNFILIKIDRNKREFKSLSQEDIIYYMKDLISKSIFENERNSFQYKYKKVAKRTIPELHYNEIEREKGKEQKTINHENALFSILFHIDLLLSKLLKNEESEEFEDD